MNNVTANYTQSNGSSFIKPVYDSCLIVLALGIIAINTLVITLFVRKDYLRTKTNSFLVSLAVSDLFTGLISIPLFLLCPFLRNVYVCIVSSALYRCIAVSTMAHILVVTLERYVAVMYPMRYYRMVTKRRICIVIGLVWVFSFMYSAIGLTWLDVFHHRIGTIGDKKRYEKPYQITGFIVCFLLPLIAMTFCFTRMFIAIRRQVKNIRKQAEMAIDPRNRSIASDKRALIIFASMLGIFVLCWLTWYLTLFMVPLEKNLVLPDKLLDVFDFLRFATSLFNPLLYTFLKHDFRRAVISICPCLQKVTKLVTRRDSNLNTRVTTFSEQNGKARIRKSSSLNSNLPVYECYDAQIPEKIKETKEPEMVELISRV